MSGSLSKITVFLCVFAMASLCLNAPVVRAVPASQPAEKRDAKRDYSEFMGTAGNSKSVIYLCDASGSMLSVFGAVKQKLKESINALDPAEKFNVIFFSDDNCFRLFKDGTLEATQANKARAIDFINDAVSTGGTQPIPAIKEAMREKPELVYLLTDGFDQIATFDDVIAEFKTGNSAGKTIVNCIFLQSDADPKLEKALKKIAEDSHGKFKKILKTDM